MKISYQSLVAAPLVLTVALLTNFNYSTASLPPIIPREVLFGNPERLDPKISPDGKYLTYLAPDKKNVMQVWIRTIGQQDDRMLTADKKRGIQEYFWSYNNKQLMFLQDSNGDENWHLHIIDISSKNVRNLTPYKGIQAQIIALNPNVPNEVLVGMNLKDRRKHDAYRINLKTGTTKLALETPGNFVSMKADSQLQVRAAVATTSSGSELLVREGSNKPWRKIRNWELDDQGEVVGFSSNGKTLYIKDNRDTNAIRLLALNLVEDQETVLAQDPQYDVERMLIDPVKREVQAVGLYKDKLEWKLQDKSIVEDFAALAKVRRGTFTVIDRDLANKTWLVYYVTDNGPVYYYIYNPDSKKSIPLFSNQPKLEGLSLAQIKPVSFESRDGLTIHGYLTTPVGIPAKNLPTVLLVHGGPWDRDKWGYDPMVQWLANRGYAVLQINFRGSTGYGKKFLNAGNREWGSKMQDDLVDGVNWIVEQGIADQNKIGIMGGSYGGYATLAGLTFTPDVFACGISIVGPSNLLTLLNSIPSYWEPMKIMLRRRVGDERKEPDFLKSRSPLFFVDRIKAPLLIGQGANDPRVKQAESEQIVAAMRKTNKLVKYIVYTDEGHGFVRPENQLHFFANAEEFLGKHLGGRIEPIGDISGHSGIVK